MVRGERWVKPTMKTGGTPGLAPGPVGQSLLPAVGHSQYQKVEERHVGTCRFSINCLPEYSSITTSRNISLYTLS